MPVALGAAGAGWARALGRGRAGQAPLSEESCLGPQLRDKERQVIKERFKVSQDPVPSTAAAAAGATHTQTFVSGSLLFPPCWRQGFNDGLEELCKIQKAWAIPDTEQRDKIRQAQKHIVKETYGAFLHR